MSIRLVRKFRRTKDRFKEFCSPVVFPVQVTNCRCSGETTDCHKITVRQNSSFGSSNFWKLAGKACKKCFLIGTHSISFVPCSLNKNTLYSIWTERGTVMVKQITVYAGLPCLINCSTISFDKSPTFLHPSA